MTNILRQLISGVFLLCSAMSAQAHPHVWVTTETTILYENGTFVGLRHKWVFDELYSASAVEGLTKNKDGKYDQEELAKADIEGLHESTYFTSAALAGERIKLEAARDYWLEFNDGILSLHFTVPSRALCWPTPKT
jgi:ABC-type uncharacterized transport system substrate-binding protein